MAGQALADELMGVFVVHVVGNAERPLSLSEILERVENLPLDDRLAIIHHYFQEDQP